MKVLRSMEHMVLFQTVLFLDAGLQDMVAEYLATILMYLSLPSNVLLRTVRHQSMVEECVSLASIVSLMIVHISLLNMTSASFRLLP